MKPLLTATPALLAALGLLAACDTKTATTGEARTPSTAEAITPRDPEKAATSGEAATATEEADVVPAPDPSTIPARKAADAATIYARPQVPVLYYHQIRNWTARDDPRARHFAVPVARFREQLKMLADSGYHTILPDQLYAYLTTGARLPSKPVMLTFDEADLSQFATARPVLAQYGYRGVYFVTLASLGQPGRLTRDMVRQLAAEGHQLGLQPATNPDLQKSPGTTWAEQLDQPRQTLEALTGKPVKYLAYPFGSWREESYPELKKRAFVAAFILNGERDPREPLFTIRRLGVSGEWSPGTLHRSMVQSFN